MIIERIEVVTARIGITKRKLLGSSYEQVKRSLFEGEEAKRDRAG